MAPAANSSVSQAKSTGTACKVVGPVSNVYLNAAGTHKTTVNTRKLWPAATRLRTAPLRAPRLTISPEPPGMLEKNAVARSSPLRSMIHTLMMLDRLVSSAPHTISQKCASTCSITVGVKCRPMPIPIIHWPHFLPPGISANCQGVRQRTRMTASNEPTIQGNGQPIRLAR